MDKSEAGVIERRVRHDMLHRNLDELVEDYLHHHPGTSLDNISVNALSQWSFRQTAAAQKRMEEV